MLQTIVKIMATICIAFVVLFVLLRLAHLPNIKGNGFTRNWSTFHPKILSYKETTLPIVDISGLNKNYIFFSVTNPQWQIVMDYTLQKVDTIWYGLKFYKELLNANHTIVDSPTIYFVANNLPGIFKGKIFGQKIDSVLINVAAITQSTIVDQSRMVIRALDNDLKKQTFHIVNLKDGNTLKSMDLFKTQNGFGFEYDGLLDFDKPTSKIIYVQHFQNQIYCLDTNLKIQYISKTIDTVSTNSVKITKVTRKDEQRIVPSQARSMINAKICTYDGRLFVVSNLKSDNELLSEWKRFYPIDVYDINTGKYIESFKIQRFEKSPILKISAQEKRLCVLYKNKIVVYELNY